MKGKNNSSAKEQKALQDVAQNIGNATHEAVKNVKKFTDGNGAIVDKVNFDKKGIASTHDGGLFNGSLDFVNSRNQKVHIEYLDGRKIKSKIGDEVEMDFRYGRVKTLQGEADKMTVFSRKSGLEQTKTEIIKDSDGKVSRVIKDDKFTDFRNGKITARGDFSSGFSAELYDEDGKVIRKYHRNPNISSTINIEEATKDGTRVSTAYIQSDGGDKYVDNLTDIKFQKPFEVAYRKDGVDELTCVREISSTNNGGKQFEIYDDHGSVIYFAYPAKVKGNNFVNFDFEDASGKQIGISLDNNCKPLYGNIFQEDKNFLKAKLDELISTLEQEGMEKIPDDMLELVQKYLNSK